MKPNQAVVAEATASAATYITDSHSHNLVWLFNDQMSIRQNVLDQLPNSKVVHFATSPQTQRQTDDYLKMLRDQQPDVLYIRAAGKALG